jgi:hypothetical protein
MVLVLVGAALLVLAGVADLLDAPWWLSALPKMVATIVTGVALMSAWEGYGNGDSPDFGQADGEQP